MVTNISCLGDRELYEILWIVIFRIGLVANGHDNKLYSAFMN